MSDDLGVPSIPESYITLPEASAGGPYSADYLRLRARQGKLRAVKLGNSWYTTKQWVQDYKQAYSGKEDTTEEVSVPVKVQPIEAETSEDVVGVEPGVLEGERLVVHGPSPEVRSILRQAIHHVWGKTLGA